MTTTVMGPFLDWFTLFGVCFLEKLCVKASVTVPYYFLFILVSGMKHV